RKDAKFAKENSKRSWQERFMPRIDSRVAVPFRSCEVFIFLRVLCVFAVNAFYLFSAFSAPLRLCVRPISTQARPKPPRSGTHRPLLQQSGNVPEARVAGVVH